MSCSKDWYLPYLVSTPCFSNEDGDRLFLSFGSPESSDKGIGRDWPFGMNLFQVIAPPMWKCKHGIQGSQALSLQHWTLCFLPYFFCSACFPPPVEMKLQSYKQMIPLLDAAHLVPWSIQNRNTPPTSDVLLNKHLLCHQHIYWNSNDFCKSDFSVSIPDFGVLDVAALAYF